MKPHITEPNLDQHLRSMFPDGVSRMGNGWFAAPVPLVPPDGVPNGVLELVWELARRHVAPDAPSRLMSVFACASETELQRMAASVPGFGTYRVAELDVETGFRADMRWVSADTTLGVSWRASQYWLQAASSDPVWEYVVPLPVSVIRVR